MRKKLSETEAIELIKKYQRVRSSDTKSSKTHTWKVG